MNDCAVQGSCGAMRLVPTPRRQLHKEPARTCRGSQKLLLTSPSSSRALLYRALEASCPFKQPQEPHKPLSPVSLSPAGAEGCEERPGLSHAWICQGQRPGSLLAGDTAHRRWQLEGQTHRVGWSSFTLAPAPPLLTGAQGRRGMALSAHSLRSRTYRERRNVLVSLQAWLQ